MGVGGRGRDWEGRGLEEEARGRGGGGTVAWAGGEASRTGWRPGTPHGWQVLADSVQASLTVFFKTPAITQGLGVSTRIPRPSVAGCPRRPSVGKLTKMVAWRRPCTHASTGGNTRPLPTSPPGRWAHGC